MILNIVFTSGGGEITIDFDAGVRITKPGDVADYTGAYDVMPTAQDQIIPTKGKRMLEDLTVKAIPKQYGLVTYNQDKTITIT